LYSLITEREYRGQLNQKLNNIQTRSLTNILTATATDGPPRRDASDNPTGPLAESLAFHLARRGPAVHDDRLPGHPRGRIGGEEDAGVRDLLDPAPAAHPDARGDRFIGLLRLGVGLRQHLEVAFGLDGPRRDAIHTDALARPRRAQLAREHDDGGFRRAVVRHHRRAVDAGDRRDVHDDSGALRHHLLAGPLAAEEDAVEVDADDGVPTVDRDIFGL